MPYSYDQPAGARDRITQALMDIQNPPPTAQMPQPPTMPNLGATAPSSMPQAAAAVPGVSPAQPPMMGGMQPGATMPGATPTLGQQQFNAAQQPGAMPQPMPAY